MKTPTFDRLWAKVAFQSQGCWLWTGALRNGYGHLGAGGKRGRSLYPHRLVYQLLVGAIPDKMEIDHLCRVRHCVNPLHLEAVTKRENLLRGESPMAQGARKTHCKRGHPLSGDNLVVYGPRRSCGACRAARNRSRARSQLP